MLDTNIMQRFIADSGGFVLALQEIPPQHRTGLVDCIGGARVVHLSELVDRAKRRQSTSGLFAITVDDGVGDKVRALLSLFREQSWPATFFLPTRYLDTGEGMAFQWWRQLRPLLPRRRLALSSGVLDLSGPGAIDRLSRKMERLWHSRRKEEYLPLTMELLEVVTRETGLKRDVLQPAAPLAWSEVEELSKTDLFRFESHGVSHAAMSALTEEELAFEMKNSRDVVAEHTGRPCRHLAYPFGSRTSIGTRAAAAAARFYDSAVTMSLGNVDSANPWLLPRIPLYPHNPPLFARLKIILRSGNFYSGKPKVAA